MMEADRFQEKYDALEKGEALEDCLKGLAPEEAELLRLAASLRTLTPPERNEDAVMEQLAALTKMAGESQPVSADQIAPSRNGHEPAGHIQPQEEAVDDLKEQPSPQWLLTLSISTATLASVIFILIVAGMGLWWAGAARARNVALADLSGSVMVASTDAGADWRPAGIGTRIRPGQQIRVGPGSSASLVFYEGSRVILDAGSQIRLEQVRGDWFNSLLVEMVQESGTTQHSVVPLRGVYSRYQVITPAGIVSVHGTDFSVAVDEGGYARFAVDTGEIRVERDTGDITLTAGQAAVAQPGERMSNADYQFTLIGPVERVVTGVWSVNGVAFLVTPDTRITGEPDVGSHVSAEGRIVDGERIADHIAVLTGEKSESSFTGVLEAMEGAVWQVGGMDVLVTADTQITGDLQIGQPVKVIFTVTPEGNWLALEIIALEAPPVKPTPTPTDTETGTLTLTLSPTGTNSPTSTDKPITNTPVATRTPAATFSPTVTNTPVAPPTRTATPPPAATHTPIIIEAPIIITGNDQVLTIDCNGAAVTVNGNGNTLTLLGTCSSLTVHGNNNHITLENPTTVTDTGNGNVIDMPAAPTAQLSVTPSPTTVSPATPSPTTQSPTPQSTATPSPTAQAATTQAATTQVTATPTTSATQPTATQSPEIPPATATPTGATPSPDASPTGTPAAAANTLIITDNNQILTINCNGAAVTLKGNDNTLTLLGTCSSLTVHGNNNEISLEFPTTVTDTGNGNTIH